MRHPRFRVTTALVLLALAGCGGGGSDTAPRVNITGVKVMGDSLADVGTFGFKFTAQGTAAAPSLVFPERIAQSYGQTLCNHYTATSATTFVVNPTNPACTDYAIGGARINNFTGPTSPLSVVQQLMDASAAGSYAAGDLLVIDGGANDAADLIGAFLTIPTDRGASYSALLQTILPAATVGAALATTSGAATIGGTYLAALADKFYTAISTYALGKGAQRIALLNMPSILNTPRFHFVLAAVSAAASAQAGGGTAGAAAGAAAVAEYTSIFNSWLVAYNTELAAKFAGNPNVVIVDFYTALNEDYNDPPQFGLTNVNDPVCPPTGRDSSGLPTYTFATCTTTSLSATTPPAGATGGSNWWKTYLFADSFHPTPYGYDLLARYISRSLATAGWL